MNYTQEEMIEEITTNLLDEDQAMANGLRQLQSLQVHGDDASHR
jgi:hypothetical protein